MINRTECAVADIALRLYDDAYLAWLNAEADSGQALQAWSDEKASTRAAAYLSYQAALEREETAARDLQRLSTLAHRAGARGERTQQGVAPSRCSGDAPSAAPRGQVRSPSAKGKPWPIP